MLIVIQVNWSLTLQEGQVSVSLYSRISSFNISSISLAISIFFSRSTYKYKQSNEQGFGAVTLAQLRLQLKL